MIKRIESVAKSGINPSTLNVWLSRSKMTTHLPDGTRAPNGAVLNNKITDPDKVK